MKYKYRVQVVVNGCMGRPSYDGYVDIYSDDPMPDLHDLVFRKLRITSFPEIWKDEVVIKASRMMLV